MLKSLICLTEYNLKSEYGVQQQGRQFTRNSIWRRHDSRCCCCCCCCCCCPLLLLLPHHHLTNVIHRSDVETRRSGFGNYSNELYSCCVINKSSCELISYFLNSIPVCFQPASGSPGMTYRFIPSHFEPWISLKNHGRSVASPISHMF